MVNFQSIEKAARVARHGRGLCPFMGWVGLRQMVVNYYFSNRSIAIPKYWMNQWKHVVGQFVILSYYYFTS